MENYTSVIGFDFGTKKIGVAVGQSFTKTAQPLTTIKYSKNQPDWQTLNQIIEEWQPTAFVVGLPLQMDDSPQKITELAKQFANALKNRYGLDVFMVDERLTTKEARSLTFEKSGYRGLQKEQLDAIAAALIVEDWFQQY